MSTNNFSRNPLDRRKFMQFMTAIGATSIALPRKLFSAFSPQSNSRVVVVEDDSATSGNSIDESAVQVMMDAGIKNLTGISDVGEAWKSLMPNLKATGIIAIKVNCRSSALPTHPEVTNAVIEGLKQMTFAGVSFPENNIHIYDNFKAYFSESGYTINTSSTGVRCYTTTQYSSARYDVNGSSQRICTLITDTADYLINIGVLKNHASMAGATLCLKNHFGTCDSPRNMHINYGDPYIGALNALEPIKNKQCISILDALYGAAEGGPYGGATFVANKLIMSKDIVAVDHLGRELLQEQNSSTVSWASYIDSAVNYGLGTNDPSQMDIINITNPTTTGVENSDNNLNVPNDFQLEQNYPNPFNAGTKIKFYAAKTGEVELAIYNARGQHVRTLVNRSINTGWHQVAWDGRNEAGRMAASGIYICHFRSGSYKNAITMQLLK
ncbi:MAG: DUF362 domain-containing protein [Calditrichaeota bacterium]|nr:MAG: DUF362 domain-containing protein [Calditrichota bacterium]